MGISAKWLAAINELNKQNNYKTKRTKPLQEIKLLCSMQPVKCSLDQWGNDNKIPKNIRKLEIEISHNDITKENYLEKDVRDKWEPYAKNDILSLAACVSKYNTQMKQLINQTMGGSLTSSAITFKGFSTHETAEPLVIHSHTDVWTRNYIQRAVKGGRVSANIQRFHSQQFEEIKRILLKSLNPINQNGEPSPIELMQL